jgi:type I restriction enzyme S subunit
MQQLLTGKKRLPGFSGEWKRAILSQIAVVTMGSSPKSEAYNDNSDGLPLLQGNADIKKRRSSPRIYTSQITKECHIGDILLSVRAPVGEISRSIHHACIGRGIAAIRAKSNISQDFIYQWLLYYEPKWKKLSQGSTFESVNSSDIKSIHIEIPPVQEQQKVASVLSAADKEIELLEQKLGCLRQEKKALMQQLLTGKRRVQINQKGG